MTARIAFFGEVDLPSREEAHVLPGTPVAASAVTGPIPVLVPRMAVRDRVALSVAAVLGSACVGLFGVALDIIIGGAS